MLSGSASRWVAYHNTTNDYAHSLSSAKNLFFKTTLPYLPVCNQHKFWKVVKGDSNTVVEFFGEDGAIVSRPNCSSLLNDVFASSFTDVEPTSLSLLCSIWCSSNLFHFPWLGWNWCVKRKNKTFFKRRRFYQSKVLEKCENLFFHNVVECFFFCFSQ